MLVVVVGGIGRAGADADAAAAAASSDADKAAPGSLRTTTFVGLSDQVVDGQAGTFLKNFGPNNTWLICS